MKLEIDPDWMKRMAILEDGKSFTLSPIPEVTKLSPQLPEVSHIRSSLNSKLS